MNFLPVDVYPHRGWFLPIKSACSQNENTQVQCFLVFYLTVGGFYSYKAQLAEIKKERVKDVLMFDLTGGGFYSDQAH